MRFLRNYLTHIANPHHFDWQSARSVTLAYRIAKIHTRVESCPHCDEWIVRR